MEEVNSEWKYYDPLWEDIKGLIGRQEAIILKLNDFGTVINDDNGVLSNEISFYQQYISNEIKEKQDKLSFQIEEIKKGDINNFSLECIRLLYNYLSPTIINKKISADISSIEKELINTTKDIFDIYSKTKNIIKSVKDVTGRYILDV